MASSQYNYISVHQNELESCKPDSSCATFHFTTEKGQRGVAREQLQCFRREMAKAVYVRRKQHVLLTSCGHDITESITNTRNLYLS